MMRGPRANIEYELKRLNEARNSLILRLAYWHNGKQCYVDLRKEDIEDMITSRKLGLEQGQFAN